MSPDGSGSIRVFVRWHEQTIFAGEDIGCRITFKNVAPSQSPSPHPDRPSPLLHPSSGRPKPAGLAPPPAARGHRSSLSLSVPAASSPGSHHRAGSTPWSPSNASEGQPPRNGGHRRSISIVSIGDGQRPGSASSSKSQRPSRGHTRASSLQIASHGLMANGVRAGNMFPGLPLGAWRS